MASGVINFIEKRKEAIEQRRREFERLLFRNFLGVYTVLSDEGKIIPIEIINISDKGCQIQIPSSCEIKNKLNLKDKFMKSGELLKKMCEEDGKLHYIDVWTPMCEKNGDVKKDIFLKDKLHMNAKGYKIWTDTIKPYLEKKK